MLSSITNRAVVIWLSGAALAGIRHLPEVQALTQRAALVELDPAPITGSQSHYYQAFSGRLPATFGFFDTLLPRNYAVTHELTGRGTLPKTLPDLLRTVGWTVAFEEVPAAKLVDSIQQWATSTPASPACLIVKCAASEVDESTIGRALRLAGEVVGETGLLALFSEAQPALVERFVNINNFLADMGVIERDEQSGQINWQNSLAYYAGHGQLWVNLLGRDQQGAVHPQDEYEEVRETLIKALPAKLRDENGAAVIERVYRKEELYTGDYLFCAPDLVVVFKPGYAPSPRSTRLEFDETTFSTPAAGTTVEAGVHPSMLTGFLLAAAPALASGVSTPEHAALTAVVPTLLHALDVEYVDLDGTAVAELFLPSYLETHPIRSSAHSQELSEEDEELIIGHLRDLGYV
jgi:Type I phosphodiesterase / nucleotide pyrophosphatase